MVLKSSLSQSSQVRNQTTNSKSYGRRPSPITITLCSLTASCRDPQSHSTSQGAREAMVSRGLDVKPPRNYLQD